MVAALSNNDATLIQMMHSAGCVQSVKLADTLQGSIWKSLEKSTNKQVVFKFARRNHWSQIATVNNHGKRAQTNIKKEARILQYLSKGESSKYIPKYIASGQTNDYVFLQMANGGGSLFEFVVFIHRLIDEGYVDITEWHKLVKTIFKQMIECIEYLHRKNVCHFDISLHNFLINDLNIRVNHENKMEFCIDDDDSVQIKLCDFGLAGIFAGTISNNHRSSFGFHSNKYCGKRNYQSPEISSRKQSFSAKSNDIWCLGVCLFMMITGTAPWSETTDKDHRFTVIMNGDVMRLLSSSKKQQYVNTEIVLLFELFFTLEENRITLDKLKNCQWLLRT